MRSLTDNDLDLGELLDIDEFVGMVVDGEIGDEDGYCHLVIDDVEVSDKEYSPSDVAFYLDTEGLGTTHVLWFKA